MQLTDRHGRTITSLRVSVTDRCNFRCIYCMQGERPGLPREELLSFEEIQHVVRIVAHMGVDKVRLTGGEPTLRQNLPQLVRMVCKVEGIHDIAMTTNGLLLKELAGPLREAGLQRVNVTLDSLRREKFYALTQRDALDDVLLGIAEAERVGFHPIKINVVALRGNVEEESLAFARIAIERGFQVRFIEYMPLGDGGTWGLDRYVPGHEIIRRIHQVYPLKLIPDASRGPAIRYRFQNGHPGGSAQGEIAVIPSVSRPFCSECNRIRLMADGKLRTCLFSINETDLRAPLRTGASDATIGEIIREAVWRKESGHRINRHDFVKPSRTMSMIGG